MSESDYRSEFLRRLGKLRELWERLTAVRLIQIVKILKNERVDSHSSMFAQSWDLFSTLQGKKLRQALQQSSLQQWISEAESLISGGEHRQYSERMAAILARFSALMMNIAPLFPSGRASGPTILMDSRALPLFLHTAALRTRSTQAYKVHWTWENGSLEIFDTSRGPAVLDANGFSLDKLEGCRLEASKALGSMAAFAAPLCVEHAGLCYCPSFHDNARQSFERMPDLIQASIEALVNVVVPICPQHTTEIAGMLSLNSSPAPVHFIEAFARDLAHKMSYIYTFQTGSSLWEDAGFRFCEDMIQQMAIEFAWFDILSGEASGLILVKSINACVSGTLVSDNQDCHGSSEDAAFSCKTCQA